ncbi:MAG TPA: hypothetical protein VG839_08865 [Asticcacaulis sp.]|nr:hypothetical protein [Asticcacaulis sp.]
MKPMLAQLAALVLGAVVATAAWAEPLSKADKDAFDAIAKKHFPVLANYESQALHVVAVWPIDDAKMCTIRQALLTEGEAYRAEELALLHSYEKAGKDIEPLISDFLGTSGTADRYFWSMADSCAAAQAAKDGHGAGTLVERLRWQAIYRDEVELARLDKVRAAQARAETGKDRLESLSDLQSLDDLLSSLTTTIGAIRDLGGDPEPRAAALIARLPALEAELAQVQKRTLAEVKPYTDPRHGKPYVHTPLVIPPVPDNEDDFMKAAGPLFSQASEPMFEAFEPLMKNDMATACPLLKDGDNDMTKLKAFIEAYVAKRTAAGGDVTNPRKLLGSVTTMLDRNREMLKQNCQK